LAFFLCQLLKKSMFCFVLFCFVLLLFLTKFKNNFMKKILLILSLIPVFGMTQSSTLSVEEKHQIKAERSLKSAYQIANQSQINNLSKTLKQFLDSSVYYESDGANSHYTLYKNHFYYTPSGLNTSQYTWIYDFADDTIGKTINTFNQANQLISSISYSKLDENWEIGDWIFDTKKNFLYNMQGQLIQEIDSTFDETLQVFELYLDITLTYDANNRVTEILGNFGDPIVNPQKITFEYNSDGTVKREKIWFYNAITEVFTEKRIYDFEYTGTNSTKTKKQAEDFQTQTMQDDGSIIKYYDTEYTKDNLILPTGLIWIDIFQIMPEDLIGSYTNKLDSLHQFGDTLSTNYWGKNIFYYNQKDIVGTKDLNPTKIEIFPNPTNGEINVKNLPLNSNIEIFDIYGKMVVEHKAISSHKINLSGLSNGIYTLRIKENNTISISEKIILNK
jgi:hypothetical protein